MGRNKMPTCICPGCTAIGMVKMDIDKRGGRDGWMCEYHAFHEESYDTENKQTNGTENKIDPFTYSVEFETERLSTKARAEMLTNGFLPTSDGSIDGPEMKSPIYYGLNAWSRYSKSLDKYVRSGNINVNGDCGTHLHIGIKAVLTKEATDRGEGIAYIRRFYHSLFVPLCEAISEDEQKARHIFGRFFVHYASRIYRGCDEMEHRNFINVQHDYSIEFRICKFANSAQYMSAIKFWKKVMICVNNNFLAHCSPLMSSDYGRKIAKQTGERLVKIWRKYSPGDED